MLEEFEIGGLALELRQMFWSTLHQGNSRMQLTITAGTDPGEVKWVNFHPPFSEPPNFFPYPSTRLWFYYIITKIHPPIPKSWIHTWTGHSGFVVEETYTGNSHYYHDGIIFEKLHSQSVFCPHENEKLVCFQIPPVWSTFSNRSNFLMD